MQLQKEIDKEQIFLGSLLGDGSIVKRKGNAYYYESHSLKQKDYLEWKSRNFPYPIIEFKIYKDRALLCSKRNPLLNGYEGYRKNPIKLKQIINQLELLGFIIWMLDDGNFNYRQKRINLSTLGFDYSTLFYFKGGCINRWGLNPKIEYVKLDGGYVLIFNCSDTRKVVKICEPYFDCLPSGMLYKFGLDKDRQRIANQKIKRWAKDYRKRTKKHRSIYFKNYRLKNYDKVREYDKKWKDKNIYKNFCEFCGSKCRNLFCESCNHGLRKIGLWGFETKEIVYRCQT